MIRSAKSMGNLYNSCPVGRVFGRLETCGSLVTCPSHRLNGLRPPQHSRTTPRPLSIFFPWFTLRPRIIVLQTYLNDLTDKPLGTMHPIYRTVVMLLTTQHFFYIYRLSQNLCHKLLLVIPHPKLSIKVPINMGPKVNRFRDIHCCVEIREIL